MADQAAAYVFTGGKSEAGIPGLPHIITADMLAEIKDEYDRFFRGLTQHGYTEERAREHLQSHRYTQLQGAIEAGRYKAQSSGGKVASQDAGGDEGDAQDPAETAQKGKKARK